MTKQALISVSDKRGVAEFARELNGLGYRLISTGGTAGALEQAGIPVRRVEQLTGFPEIMDGRVKTLHPKVHAGILARLPQDGEHLERLGIEPIDLVAVNLYPFRETVARGDVTLEQAVEQIDIGGPSMLRAAAKNFARVTVVVNPERYPEVIRELREQGATSPATRLRLAREAFWHTAVYDAAITNYLYAINPDEMGATSGESGKEGIGEANAGRPRTSNLKLQAAIMLPLVKLTGLRYGENPHQQAAFYRDETGYEAGSPHGLAGARQLQGPELSFNNILDLDAAVRVASEFQGAAAVVIKHNKPSGVACAASLEEAFRLARQADATAAYGGIVGLNRTVDRATAEAVRETFFEAVIAPAFTEEALKILSSRQKLRLLAVGERGLRQELDFKRVSGGFLLQESDPPLDLNQVRRSCRVVTRQAPTEDQWDDLLFAWVVVKHAVSNGIVIAGRAGADPLKRVPSVDGRRGRVTLGIGQGQVSRIDAVNIALAKAGARARGAVLASDGFLPFDDSVRSAAAAGVAAIIQPGGSVHDREAIAAADAVGMAMVCTGSRHFKH
jgi:phosphoribosylaminoimidazolecarboxamide formyltransferase/IMP cyclohydrolase